MSIFCGRRRPRRPRKPRCPKKPSGRTRTRILRIPTPGDRPAWSDERAELMMLADTLYRVPRQPGLHVLHRRAPRHAQWLTSWRLILEPGRSAKYSSKDEEAVFVLQQGTGSLEASGTRH